MASTRDLVLAPCTRRRPRRTGRRERPHLTHVFDELQSRVIEQQVRTGEDRKQRRKLSRVPGACDFLLNLLSYGEEVLSELICHIILREGDHSWEDKGRGTCPHFAQREDAEKDLGALPWSWGLPEHRGVRLQAHSGGLRQQGYTHRGGLQRPPGPPATAGWCPSSLQGCSLGRCAPAPPAGCGTRPRCTLWGRHRPQALVGDAQDTPETRETRDWSDCPPAGAGTLPLPLTLFAACR